MTKVVLLAHWPLASALKAVAAHVYPDCGGTLEAIDVEPDVAPATVEARLANALNHLVPAEVLILVDVFGATPCNVAMKLADGVRTRVVAGVNVPMLWRTMCYRHEPLEALVGRAVAGAAQGVMQVAVPKPSNQNGPALPDRDDPVGRSDQQ